MRKILLIMLSVVMSMMVLSSSLSAVSSKQNAAKPNFCENTAMAEWQSVVEDECEHDFYEWSYRSTSDIDGTKYHHRECRKCGYIECELHENRYGGCSICEYGSFDFSSINLSDTAGMTTAELAQYMSDIFGETNCSFKENSSIYLDVHRDSLSISARKYDYYDDCNIDGTICLDIFVHQPGLIKSCFYVMDGIQIGDTPEHILSEAAARGYNVKIRKAHNNNYGGVEKIITIDNGKVLFEFSYFFAFDENGNEIPMGNEFGDYLDCIVEGRLYTCREDYGGMHPEHDLSHINLECILGMEKAEGIAKLKELFGDECVKTDYADMLFVDCDGQIEINRLQQPGCHDFLYLTYKLKYAGNKFIFNKLELIHKEWDHMDMKPTFISELPSKMTVKEINKLAETLGAEINTYEDTSHEELEGAQCTTYTLTLEKYEVVYSVSNYRKVFQTGSGTYYELIPEDEWQDAYVGLESVKLLDSALPVTPADVNSDGEVTLDDAVTTLQKAMNVGTDSGTFIDQAADVTRDGEISLDDAIEILKIAMKVNS